MTLTPAPYDAETGEVLARLLTAFAHSPATAWITFDVVEFTANVAMFAPLGILSFLWFGRRPWWIAPVLGFALSAAIETTQLLFLETRVADVRDLVANTLGAAIGFILVALPGRQARRRRP